MCHLTTQHCRTCTSTTCKETRCPRRQHLQDRRFSALVPQACLKKLNNPDDAQVLEVQECAHCPPSQTLLGKERDRLAKLPRGKLERVKRVSKEGGKWNGAPIASERKDEYEGFVVVERPADDDLKEGWVVV